MLENVAEINATPTLVLLMWGLRKGRCCKRSCRPFGGNCSILQDSPGAIPSLLISQENCDPCIKCVTGVVVSVDWLIGVTVFENIRNAGFPLLPRS